jgi:DNA primase
LTFPTLAHTNLISKATIDTVFETARVEEVIGDFVNLKRAGSNFKGLSPFLKNVHHRLWCLHKGIWKILVQERELGCVLMEHENLRIRKPFGICKK